MTPDTLPDFGLTPAQWGAVMIIFAVLFLWLRIFQRIRAVLVFAGICLLGGSLLGRLMGALARGASNVTDTLTGKIFGTAVPGLLVLIVGAVLIHDLHPRGGGASRRTFWLAAILAACLVAGLSTIVQLDGIPAGVHSTVTTVTGG